MSRFKLETADFQLTISCSVTEVMPDDTPEALCARTLATLHEAKRYGGNCTFIDEDKYTTPVVPPDFTLNARTITL